MKEIIYISGPYTSPDPLVRGQREYQLTRAAAIFAKHGHIVYSPITHSAPLARTGVKLTHEEWIEFDRPFMELCTRCVVVPLDGWILSRGVKAELEYFAKANKPVFCVMLEDAEDYAKRWAEQFNQKSEKENENICD
jgi:nucleoside 2-deoxyribosyltransferase